jgi:beta-glucosidase
MARNLKRIQDKSMKEIGIPCIYGVTKYMEQLIRQAEPSFHKVLTWEQRSTVSLLGGSRISAYEQRQVVFRGLTHRVVDLGRDPRWARQWRTTVKMPT